MFDRDANEDVGTHPWREGRMEPASLLALALALDFVRFKSSDRIRQVGLPSRVRFGARCSFLVLEQFRQRAFFILFFV